MISKTNNTPIIAMIKPIILNASNETFFRIFVKILAPYTSIAPIINKVIPNSIISLLISDWYFEFTYFLNLAKNFVANKNIAPIIINVIPCGIFFTPLKFGIR